MTKEEAFHALRGALEHPENYVHRDYQTMGGMWTVDTWHKGDVSYQLMDEGYTGRIRGPGLEVWDSIDGVRISHGDVALMEATLTMLTGADTKKEAAPEEATQEAR